MVRVQLVKPRAQEMSSLYLGRDRSSQLKRSLRQLHTDKTAAILVSAVVVPGDNKLARQKFHVHFGVSCGANDGKITR